MPTLRWDRMTWEEFGSAVVAYKEKFSHRPDEDFAYLRCRKLLDGRSIGERASKARDIVLFLNNWKCMINKTDSPPMLAAWIRENDARLEALAHLTILDDELPGRVFEVQALYDSLMAAGRDKIPNWSDAATAKTLHQLIPGLFVMWDRNILPFADDYGDFMLEMHRLALRLIEEGPYASANELEQSLQEQLGYGVRKTTAKYLDEFNWYEMVGAAR